MSDTGWLLSIAVVALVAVWLVGRDRRRLRALLAAASREDEGALLDEPVSGLREELRTVLRAQRGAHRRAVEDLAAAREDLEELETVLGGMVEGVLVIDGDGTVRMSNPRAEVLLDLPRDTTGVGRPLIELTRHPDVHRLVRRVTGLGARSASFSSEIVFEGEPPRVLRITVTTIAAGGGQRRFVLVLHDVTDMKRVERMRRDFVANVSHELRTPLSAIQGYSETLLGGGLRDADRAVRFVEIIERHSRRLGRLVDDLLTLSDLELGRTELRRRAVQPDALVRASVDTLMPAATEAGVTLRYEAAPETPALYVDPDQIEQVLLNLGDNAIKYTPAGGQVTFLARPAAPLELAREAGLPAASAFVELAVRDTGSGIAPSHLPRLTERFYRVDHARSRALGGTGLGLSIVKHIVHAHGGGMSIDSELNVGTTVRVYLPAVSSESP